MAEFALFISKQIKKKPTKNNKTNPKQRKNPTKMCPSPAHPYSQLALSHIWKVVQDAIQTSSHWLRIRKFQASANQWGTHSRGDNATWECPFPKHEVCDFAVLMYIWSWLTVIKILLYFLIDFLKSWNTCSVINTQRIPSNSDSLLDVDMSQ